MKQRSGILALFFICATALAEDPRIAAEAVNAFGVDLYHAHSTGEANLLLSPYAIESALAMTYAGADGDTRAEMQSALHFPADEEALHESFRELATEFATMVADSQQRAKAAGGAERPIEFLFANRLYMQRGYEWQAPFLNTLKERYAALPAEVDYKNDPETARLEINRWVQSQTRNRIRELMAPGSMPASTRLMLVNAFYLRAPWLTREVRNERFFAHGREGITVPTLVHRAECGYVAGNGLQVITCPYEEPGLQFVVAVPDHPMGLVALERALTSKLVGEWAHLPTRPIILHLPKFLLTPPTMSLSADLNALGMKTAFDDPAGSANFGRMAARRPDEYLALSAVLHRTFLLVDEKGTEAAEATGIEASALAAPSTPKPVIPLVVRVDRPFLFAIQHVPSGTCLFIGRVTDPR